MEDFYYYLYMALGVYVDKVGRIVDQDTGSPILYNNGYLINYPAANYIVHRNDTAMQITTNKKLALFLLQFLLKRLEYDDELYVKVMYPESESNNTGRYRFCVVCDDDVIYKSNYYYSEALQYVDLIFKVSEIGTHLINSLRDLDVIPE